MFTSRAATAHRPFRQSTSWLLLPMFVATHIDHVFTFPQEQPPSSGSVETQSPHLF